MKRDSRTGWSAVAILIFIFLAFGSSDTKKNKSGESGYNHSESSGTETSGGPAVVQVGEVLSTPYFDVTINKVGLHTEVNTGNEFVDLPAEEGIHYLVLNTTYLNTDTESRMILDGDVIIHYNGKEYLFDKAETMMLNGWGIMLDQINPLTSKTTNLVYKIPQGISGEAYFRPARSESNDLILIGNL